MGGGYHMGLGTSINKSGAGLLAQSGIDPNQFNNSANITVSISNKEHAYMNHISQLMHQTWKNKIKTQCTRLIMQSHYLSLQHCVWICYTNQYCKCYLNREFVTCYAIRPLTCLLFFVHSDAYGSKSKGAAPSVSIWTF